MLVVSDALLGFHGFLLLAYLGSATRGKVFVHLMALLISLMLVFLVTAGVDRFAGLWGQHATWKLAVAAGIFLIYPLVVVPAAQSVGLGGLRKTAQGLSLAAFALMIAIILYEWAVSDPIPGGIGPTWAALHPTAAIHHIYANATYLGATALLAGTYSWGRHVIECLGKLLGSERRVMCLDALTFLGAILLRVFA